MGNCCIYFLQKPKFLSYFARQHNDTFLGGDVDTLMDLDYLEEPQLTFRINERPFTVSSYLNWVSNKPRALEADPIRSAESSLSSRRGFPSRPSLSKLTGSRTPPNSSDLATQRLLFREVDPKARPPPSPAESPTQNGSWAVVASVGGQDHKTSTSAFLMSNKSAARHMISRSFHAGAVSTGVAETVEDEMDGPEIARLMRRFWPRDLNFFGGNSQPSSSGRRSLCESRSSVASSSSGVQRPVVLNLRNGQKQPDQNVSAPESFGANFESSLDLDWDHEPGAFAAPQPSSSNRNSAVITSWYTSPFESDAFAAPSRRRSFRTLPRPPSTIDDHPLMTKSACFSGQMLDSGFADTTFQNA